MAKNDFERQKSLISSSYIANAAISLLIAVIGAIAVQLIDFNALLGVSSTIVAPNILKISITIVLLGIALELFLKVSLNLFQSMQKQSIASAVPLISTIVLLILSSAIKIASTEEKLIFIAIFYLLSINLPLVVANIVLFSKKNYFKGKFSFKSFSKKTAFEVTNLGGLFFLIQIFGLLVNSTDQLLISNIYGPSFTVTYQMYYKLYFSVAALASTISLPVWAIVLKSAAEGKINWIANLQKKLWLIWTAFIGANFLIFILLQPIFNIWLGEDTIPVNYLYSLLFALWSSASCLSYLLAGIANGTKALKTQIIIFAIGALIKIPAAFLFARYTSIGWISVLLPSILTLLAICVVQPFENVATLKKLQKKPLL